MKIWKWERITIFSCRELREDRPEVVVLRNEALQQIILLHTVGRPCNPLVAHGMNLWLTVILGPTYLPRYVLILWFALPGALAVLVNGG